MAEKEIRIIVSGGGTGGHIFPAVSIANAVKDMCPEAKILFVGAEGKMEMQRVPAAGYEIIGLPVRGLIRPLWSPKNIGVMIDFIKSRQKVKKVIRDFKPQVAVGVGGYASAPTLNAAHSMGIPCLIQEQNSYAGVTNKSLAKKAQKICVAYEGMERFFPAGRILLTGNPVRQALLENNDYESLTYGDAYINNCYSSDGAYLSTNEKGTTVEFKLSGDIGKISIDEVNLIPIELVKVIGDKILLIQTQFSDDIDLDGYFILVPDMESYKKILTSLGLVQ